MLCAGKALPQKLPLQIRKPFCTILTYNKSFRGAWGRNPFAKGPPKVFQRVPQNRFARIGTARQLKAVAAFVSERYRLLAKIKTAKPTHGATARAKNAAL